MKFPVSIQMYTLRNEIQDDFIGTLEKIAKIGYQGIELLGNEHLSAAELKMHLDRLNLKVSGSHISLEEIKNNLENIIKYNKEIGSKYIICSYADFNNQEDFNELSKILSLASIRCNEEGLNLCYHNHAHEFKMINGKNGLDALYEKCDSTLLAEIDIFWVYYAGINPVEYIKKYNGRCPLIHFKDMEKGDQKSFTEVGEGVLDIISIAKACEEALVKWIVVEQDECKIAPLKSIEISYNNLSNMGII